MSDPWHRFEHQLASHAPALLEALRPPASPQGLSDLARATGFALPEGALPEGLRALYAWHDGEEEGTSGVFFGLRFLPVAEAAVEWAKWTDLIAEDPALLDDITVGARPEGAVRAVYAHPGWVPFASDGSGNHLAVDLVPGPLGAVGQVISFGADEGTRYVVAPSTESFLSWCAEQLESDRASGVRDPDARGGEGVRLGAVGSLLDALPGALDG